ncbi:MAG: NAD(P)-dependent oxidoreductase [Bacteroidota bacterium]|nr:NAD(P)-dependent oxidoreductase [Bacteroidota bacterium]
MNIGFIGLGSLGTPIARNLLERGHSLYVYNRTAHKTATLAEAGARVCKSIEALARESAIVFTIVSDDAALQEISAELVKWMQHGAVHISMSTVSGQTANDISEQHQQHGQIYIAAPVFGRPEAAAARKLNFVIAGNAAARETIKPFLADGGAAGVFDFGLVPGHANTVKLSGNFLIAAAMEAMGESIRLASESGVDPAAMWTMFTQTLFNNPIYQNYSKIILQQQFEPAAFTARLGLKDMRLVMEQAAASNVDMPLGALLKSHLQQLVEQGRDTIDWSAVALGGRNQKS